MDEPNYQLTDANGNVIGEIGATSDGAVVVEHSSGEQAVLDGDGLEVPSVSAEEANIGQISSDVDGGSNTLSNIGIESNFVSVGQVNTESIEFTDVADSTWQTLPFNEIGLYMVAISTGSASQKQPRGLFVVGQTEAFNGNGSVNNLLNFDVDMRYQEASSPEFLHTEGGTIDLVVTAWRIDG